jgi:hypothetical protein
MSISQSGRFCVGLDVPPYTGGLLQASTNFINWVDVSWFYRDLRKPPLLLEDTTTPQSPQRFYRLKQAPR